LGNMKTRKYDAAEVRRQLAGQCFICELIAGNPEFNHHVIFQDQKLVAFLSKYPQVYGYVLVAPIRHLEQVTGDLTEDEYLELQRVVYRVSEAVRRVIPTERLYILSIGSQSGNAHVHWHIVPLPPGVQFEDQQYSLLSKAEIVDVDDEAMAALAELLRNAFI
jgi:diadenosine tetraphosphate (Ap4A) HIT family hydrolase